MLFKSDSAAGVKQSCTEFKNSHHEQGHVSLGMLRLIIVPHNDLTDTWSFSTRHTADVGTFSNWQHSSVMRSNSGCEPCGARSRLLRLNTVLMDTSPHEPSSQW